MLNVQPASSVVSNKSFILNSYIKMIDLVYDLQNRLFFGISLLYCYIKWKNTFLFLANVCFDKALYKKFTYTAEIKTN